MTATKWQNLPAGSDDRKRIICSGQIPLRGLSTGIYTLELKITDEVSKVTATQQTTITIE